MRYYVVEVIAHHLLDGSTLPLRLKLLKERELQKQKAEEKEIDPPVVLNIKKTIGQPYQRADISAGIQGICYDCVISGNEHRQAWLYDDENHWMLVVK